METLLILIASAAMRVVPTLIVPADFGDD